MIESLVTFYCLILGGLGFYCYKHPPLRNKALWSAFACNSIPWVLVIGYIKARIQSYTVVLYEMLPDKVKPQETEGVKVMGSFVYRQIEDWNYVSDCAFLFLIVSTLCLIVLGRFLKMADSERHPNSEQGNNPADQSTP